MIIILCATDAGGIRNISPLIPVCLRRKISVVLVTYRNSIELFGEIKTHVDEVVFADEFTEEKLRNLIENFQPAAVICGTTRFYSPDRALISLARASGVWTVVVLDEWFNYRYRFQNLDTDELTYMPDAIAMQDNQAREEAIAEGIPDDICYVTGSPMLAELTKKARELLILPPDVPEFLVNIDNMPLITFLSETHEADYGTSPDTQGPLGPFIGYIEDTVLESVLNVIERLNFPAVLVEKLHPSAKKIQKPSLAIPENVDLHSVRKTDLWSLLWHSDVVIGMRSMTLLEAVILGCNTISFQPGLIGSQCCTAVRLGLAPVLDCEEELELWLAQHLSSLQKKRARVIRQLPFASSKSADRVIDLALSKRSYQ